MCVCLQGGDLLTVDKNRAAGGRYPDDPTAVDSAAGVSHNFCISIHLHTAIFTRLSGILWNIDFCVVYIVDVVYLLFFLFFC